MPPDSEKVTIQLDAELVASTRRALGARGKSDAAAVERALHAYLFGRLLDATQRKSRLSEEDPDKVAASEVRAARRERTPAA